MKEINDIKLYTIKETAELFGVHFITVRNWIKAEKLRASRIGRSVYVSEESIRDYLNGHTKTQQDEALKLLKQIAHTTGEE